jgi:hypothetical protein
MNSYIQINFAREEAADIELAVAAADDSVSQSGVSISDDAEVNIKAVLSWFWPQSKHEIFLIMIQYLYYAYIGIFSCQPNFALIKANGLSTAASSAPIVCVQ